VFKRIFGLVAILALLVGTLVPAMASAETSATRTYFGQDSLTVRAGQTFTMDIMVEGLPGATGHQINLQHGLEVTVLQVECSGIFQGAHSLGPVSVQGGTLVGCYTLPAREIQGSGAIITLKLQAQDDTSISLGVGGGFGTEFSNGGYSVSPGDTSDTLAVTVQQDRQRGRYRYDSARDSGRGGQITRLCDRLSRYGYTC
jgi:hypothetical protein